MVTVTVRLLYRSEGIVTGALDNEWQAGLESKPYVMNRPQTVPVAQSRLKAGDGLIDHLGLAFGHVVLVQLHFVAISYGDGT